MKHILLLCLLALTACAYDYSTGERAGQVVKFSRKGIRTKSWEGEMNLGGLKMTTNSDGDRAAVPNVFAFSVDEHQTNFGQIKARLDSATESGSRVRVWYRQSFQHNPLRFDTSYLLDSVRVVR